MKRHLSLSLAALLLAILPAAAQEANPVETKLRDNLRNTMIQLRKEQGEHVRLEAELQALKTTSEKEAKDLKAKFEDLAKRSSEEKKTADQTIEELKKNLAVRETSATSLAASLEKWKAAHAEITTVAHKKEADRAALQVKLLDTERVVADRERKNMALFETGNEILDRYEKFALGRAIISREPFTGIARVKLQEQVQDYKDKLSDKFVKSGDPVTPVKPGDLEPAVEPLPPGQAQATKAPASKPAAKAGPKPASPAGANKPADSAAGAGRPGTPPP